MATHHGRPGGRLVEVLAAFSLIGVSAVILVGALAVAFGAWMWLAAIVPTAFLTVVMASGVTYFLAPIMRSAWWVLSALWGPFSKYYKYQAHSLRPLDDEGTDK